MKKVLCMILAISVLFAAVPVAAQDEFVQENLQLEFFDEADFADKDEVTGMEVSEGISENIKKEFEKRLTAAWDNMDTEVNLYPDLKIHVDNLKSLIQYVTSGNPEYYYVKSYSYTSNAAGYLGQLTRIKYTVESMAEVKATWAEFEKAAEEILLYISPDMTDFEKIMTVHDYMVLNYVYNIEDTDQTMFIILDREGVCAAYAKAFMYVMHKLDIGCRTVSGEWYDENGDLIRHMWNIVNLDGEWYHIDVTWDDPVPDHFASVNHRYALFSTEAIINHGHKSFDMGGFTADSTLYDDAHWHIDNGEIIVIDSVLYRVNENDLIDEDGNVIYHNLDGGDGLWHMTERSGIRNGVLAGLCEINKVLYFNTDTGIYAYDTRTKETKCVVESYGICGIYADENVLRYNTYDFDKGAFVEKGELKISDIRLGVPYYENGKAVLRLYHDADTAFWVISQGDGIKTIKVTEKGINKLEIDNGTEQTIYIWKQSLEPYLEKITVAE